MRVEILSLPLKQGRDPPVPVAAVLAGQLHDPLRQRPFVRHFST
jgi:hypothetical protein